MSEILPFQKCCCLCGDVGTRYISLMDLDTKDAAGVKWFCDKHAHQLEVEEIIREREDYNGKHQRAVLEIERLRSIISAAVDAIDAEQDDIAYLGLKCALGECAFCGGPLPCLTHNQAARHE